MGCEGGGLCTNAVLSFFPNNMTTVIVILAAVTILIIGFGVSGMIMNFCPASTSVCPSRAQTEVEGLHGEESLALGILRLAASLELRDVQLSDAGTYQCSVTTARGSGPAVLQYRTGASPWCRWRTAAVGTLQCEAPRWFPRPATRWTAYGDTGEHLPHAANTSYELNPKNITVKVVSLQHNITANATYTGVVESSIAKAMVHIRVTGRAQVCVCSCYLICFSWGPERETHFRGVYCLEC
uniref:V-set domain containing T cell activation inhibitor 1 n=1 Tax=Taeniopygia guttata TaxID=59729 RepID=H0ZT13_TAEGU